MCGIAVTVGVDDATVFKGAFETLHHRGPDASYVADLGGIRMGCHRLAIVDPGGGTQPLQSPDGRRLLVFNGEIYNHRALREEFRGYPFATATDGEVILPLVEREGPAGLRRLRGMFAFVLIDLATGEFLAARDPLGIKPLYFVGSSGGLVLASELKALADLSGRPRFIPPGHYLTRRGLGRYYSPPSRRWRRRAPALRRLLEDAVASHLPPDGPCGVLLSGGVDSSIVAALAARVRPDLVAYTVAFPGGADTDRAAEVAAHLGLRHTVLTVGEDEASAVLADVIWHLESYNPVMVRNAVPLFLIARHARNGTKVLLGGDGADELFGGYDYLARLAPRFWPEALERGINDLHRTELQRADRMTMAHGVELRVPFLDLPLVEAAIDLPLSAKVRWADGRRMAKWALRAAADDLLPPSIARREKTPFTDGSGFSAIAARAVEGQAGAATDGYFRLWRARFPGVGLDVPLWADAGRYTDFEEDFGHPVLGLFRR